MNRDINKSLPTILLAGFVAVLLASCGQPTAPTSPTPDTERVARYSAYFEEADSNDDGIINQTEIGVTVSDDFSTMDSNGDGVITIADVYNDAQGEPKGMTRNMDLSTQLPYDDNGDDQITLDEYRAYVTSEIQKADLDSDNQITLAEYRAYEEF